ncbi:hypothetical protein J2Z17_004349 [Rhizobium halophytocola]|uniref:Uncharacterized protein n=1 Tax=Rhizobium halophytocola TaxID=735519 RepID=A0ABS4E4L7_9HYPH|nr:hypothetical protein [Rhizobium halophytocola]
MAFDITAVTGVKIIHAIAFGDCDPDFLSA